MLLLEHFTFSSWYWVGVMRMYTVALFSVCNSNGIYSVYIIYRLVLFIVHRLKYWY